MAERKFGTTINCMDGRVQDPVRYWIKENYNVEHVDTITDPGIVKLLSQGDLTYNESIKKKALISVEKHGSSVIVVAGHYDCAGNPVSKDDHWNDVRSAMETVYLWKLPVEIVGLWVNDKWEAELVATYKSSTK